MGFFSWLTVDGGKSISNSYSDLGALPVVLLVPQEFGKDIIEEEYEGYGRFDEQDAYALLARWNKPEQCTGIDKDDRGIGIYLEEKEIKYPLKFVSLDYYNEHRPTYEDFDKGSKRDPSQGYFYNEYR